MDNLEFRKFLMEYDITGAEYERMSPEEKQELQNRFNKEIQNRIAAQRSGCLTSFGLALQNIGCALMMVPIVIICIVIIWAILTSK